ncbi:MAG: RdgB/HAM1 family non-canonical purine NTP pyrophosphatase [Elusimicrobia bacterium]|nr:RdgB/HAM1 family non-canonical purine NTP pyrophosphatase [Elusimicrobiota bacterium]
MLEILIATANPHKAQEIAALLPALPVRFLTLKDFPSFAMPEENGATLEENAAIKARAAAAASGRWAMADDTGLEVDALGGAPGVHSARYAGADKDYPANNAKLLRELEKFPRGKRTARFRTVVALASPDGRLESAEGRLEGVIATRGRGSNGFGYDPLFQPLNSDKTLAELSFEEKNRISHRAAALKNAAAIIKKISVSGK